MMTRIVGLGIYECSKCGEDKAESEFNIQHRRGRTEVNSQCKVCRSLYDKNRDRMKVRVKNKRYYDEHKESEKKRTMRWQSVNRERTNEIARKVYVRHIHKMRQERRRYYINNRDKWKKYFHDYRTRKRNALGSFTFGEWAELLNVYNYTCLSCGIINVPLTADHIVPLSVGGTNFIDNIQPLCKSCNSKKATKIIDYRVAYDTQ